MGTTITGVHTCWSCGGKARGAVSASGDDREPRAGDVTICADCLEPGVLVTFSGRWSTVKPNETQLMVLEANPLYQQVLAQARAVRQRRANLRGGK